ncbi:prephenate dehydratase [Tepidanaerobacter sp. EBM-49]|uniref:prephenate dehydratase n=1 Tax=Tepidanaerobacter sp. EBM-49 TaxID=1918504 RepID=UPI000ACE6BC2|nr:prephenate dehydratase [Tepidanaerobacter sp. EBM-49]
MNIGFLGPKGTFSEEALDVWIEKSGTAPEACTKIAFPTIIDVINAVGSQIDMGIVPIENSLEGSVNTTIDCLIHEADAKIHAEVVLPITQHLFAKEEIPFDKIKYVYSHPQALYQCRKFLMKNLPNAELKEVSSTAEGARIASESALPGVAAVGGISLAKLYNLKVIANNIQDGKNNMTRFYVLSDKDAEPTGNDKTTIVFSTANRPGSLFACLKIFADKNLNLTKIESRPSRRVLGEYIFFIEVEGHRRIEPLKSAIEELKRISGFCKILGSYPKMCLTLSN